MFIRHPRNDHRSCTKRRRKSQVATLSGFMQVCTKRGLRFQLQDIASDRIPNPRQLACNRFAGARVFNNLLAAFRTFALPVPAKEHYKQVQAQVKDPPKLPSDSETNLEVGFLQVYSGKVGEGK